MNARAFWGFMNWPGGSANVGLGVMAFAVFVGCAPDVKEPSSTRLEYARQASMAGDVVVGYRHNFSVSRFAIGNIIASQDDGTTSKVVGDEGVFATDSRTGFVGALTNAISTAAAKAPLMGAEVHNDAVKSYFVGCGLPEDQIADVVAHGFSHTDIDDRSKYVADGYSTVLSRSIEGFPVRESFAWARMNADREVIAESVYWPDVPLSTVAEAKDLAVASKEASYAAAVGADTSSGLVAIHHSRSYASSVAFTATYDIPGGGGMRHGRHFDRNGAEVTLPPDVPPVPSTIRP